MKLLQKVRHHIFKAQCTCTKTVTNITLSNTVFSLQKGGYPITALRQSDLSKKRFVTCW